MLDAPLHITSQSGCAPANPDAGVLEARLRNALATVAPLVVQDPAFIPVFERLEQELAELNSRNDAVDRARAYLMAS